MKTVLTVRKCTFSFFLVFKHENVSKKNDFSGLGTKYFTTRGVKRFMTLSVGKRENFFPIKTVLTVGNLLTVWEKQVLVWGEN